MKQTGVLLGGAALAVVAIVAFMLGKGTGDVAPAVEAEEEMVVDVTPLAMVGDAEVGKSLFVSEGCVICHSVNGVGGRAAPGLDAREWPNDAGAFDFVARMWTGAPIMVELQRLELGYQINLTGQELADLSAFSRDEAVQATFTIDEVPEEIRDWFLSEISMEEDLADRYLGEEYYDFGQQPQN